MKFFDDQKVDDAGRTGVRLQKIILFFAGLTIFGGIFGLPFSLITVAIGLGILSLGFFGAYYRHPCMLKAYGIIRILELAFHLLLLTVALIAVFFLVGLVVVGSINEVNYINNYVPIQYYNGGYMEYMPAPVHSQPMQPMKEGPNHHGSTTHPTYAPIDTPVNPTDVPIDTPVNPDYVIIDYNPWVVYGGMDYYVDLASELTTPQIVGITIIATSLVAVSIVVSFAYYAVVFYTAFLSLRMATQIKRSAAVYAAVEQKECQLETAQQFVYVVADPTNGNQPVLLQPVQMQSFA